MDKDIVMGLRVISGIALVRARIGECVGEMVVDTGAMRTALNRGYFEGLGGEGLEIAKFNEQMGTAPAVGCRVESIELPGLELRDWEVMLMDLGYVEAALRQEDPEAWIIGTLGFDVLREHSVLLDLDKPEMTIDPTRVAEPAAVVGLKCEGLPVVEVEIEGAVREFVFDSGANTCLVNGELRDVIHAMPDPENPGLVILPDVTLGGRKYSGVPAVFTDISAIQAAVPGVDGVIGYQILREQPVLLDFEGGKMALMGAGASSVTA